MVASSAFKAVTKPPAHRWVNSQDVPFDLINHVKTGMLVELCTLPIYLCAMYSIKSDNGGWGTKARSDIRDIAQQEMLHLALAGNLLRALNGTQRLYNKNFMPSYPSEILYSGVAMKLRPANKENLECFLKIEAPYSPEPEHESQIQLTTVIPRYKSIGSFYKQLEQAAKQDPKLFANNKDMQFTGDEFFDSRMTVVINESSALGALETIVDEGEGGIGFPDSHHSIFVQLFQRRKDWECLDYVDEPHTDKYKGNKLAYRLSLAVNASYCYLLQTIDRCWTTSDRADRTQLLRNIHRIMSRILHPLAMILVEQKVTIDGVTKNAAPCFEFYPPLPPGGSGHLERIEPLEPSELRRKLIEEVQEAQGATSDANIVQAIESVRILLESLPDVDFQSP